MEVVGWSWTIHHNPVAFIQLGNFKLFGELLREILKPLEKHLKNIRKKKKSLKVIFPFVTLTNSPSQKTQIAELCWDYIISLGSICMKHCCFYFFLELYKNKGKTFLLTSASWEVQEGRVRRTRTSVGLRHKLEPCLKDLEQ